MLQITNTLSGRKEPFEPRDPNAVRMYVCGPTVYGPAHIGHAMSYIVFDVVRRYLEYRGYGVKHVQNFTDVDDKIINRAHELGVAWHEVSSRYTDEFLRDMESLNVRSAHAYPKASEAIPAIVEDIAGLVERGKAYERDGDVYFRVLSDPEYGKLSHRRLDQMNAGARVEVDERKEHPMDFALWKAARPGEPSWDSPWGPGRPGWHIECTSMSRRTLGDQLDIHGGGHDLIFPHHENEIAQSEGLTGVRPFSRLWMHNGFLKLEEAGDEKMSRSAGKVLAIPDVVDRYGPDAFRVFVLSSHYRRPLNFSLKALEAAATSADRLAVAVAGTGPDADTAPYAEQRRAFEAALDDDLNTSRALAVLYGLATEANRLRAAGDDPAGAVALLRELGGVLGLTLERRGAAPAGDAEPFIELLVGVRAELRAAKQFALADRVRDGLADRGVVLEDTTRGTTWRIER